jgi:ABC-type sugar transport system ATPase subunit
MSTPDAPTVKTPAPASVVRKSRPWTPRAPLPDRLLNKVLYLNTVTVSFDGFKALNALSLLIDDGELRCVIGPNGAGKTTMMDVITGKTRPDAGTAYFGQTIDLTQLTEAEIAHAGIGRKFQKPTVFEHLSVFENLRCGLLWSMGYRYAFWKFLADLKDANDRAEQLLAMIRGMLHKIFGDYKALLIGLTASAVGLYYLALVDVWWKLPVVAVLFSFGHGLGRPALTSLITQAAPPHRRRRVRRSPSRRCRRRRRRSSAGRLRPSLAARAARGAARLRTCCSSRAKVGTPGDRKKKGSSPAA